MTHSLHTAGRLLIWMVLVVMMLSFTPDRLRGEGANESNPVLTVVWVHEGDLWGWKQGETALVQLAEQNIVASSVQVRDAQPLAIAPDGTRVAFVRNFDLDSLWISDWREARELVPNGLLPVEEQGQSHIVDIGWADSNTLYFNTGASWIPRPRIVRRDDLWRVDLPTGKVEQVLPPGEGGVFTFSPDGHYAGLVTPGLYDKNEGEVELLDLTTGEKQLIFSFLAVSTGSNYTFYPQLFWEADSSALRLVIPDKDLVYDDSARSSALWRVNTAGESAPVGSVNASFYGLPQWSFDHQFVAYIQRTDRNQLELVVARGDGSEPLVYTSGEVGSLGVPNWLPDANQFVYEQGQAGRYWLGQPGESPEPFPEAIYAPQFLADGWYVYATPTAELRYARIGDTGSNLLATIGDPYPVFEATLIHPTS